MKKIFFSLIIVFAFISVKSQIIKFGLTSNTGVNNTFIALNDINKRYYYKYDENTKYYKISYTYNIGMYAEFSLREKINLGTEILYFQKTANYKIGEIFQKPELNTIVKYNYISVPISISFNFTDFFALKVGYINNFALSYKPNNIFLNDMYNKNIYSGSYLFGFDFDITKRIQLNITLTHDISPSLIDKINRDKTEIYNQTLMFGIKYKLFDFNLKNNEKN